LGAGRSDARPDDFVVTTETGLPIDLRNWRNRVFHPAARVADVKATPYDLRHTFCSLLAHEGRAMVYIAAMMGHSTIRTQEPCSHIITDAHLRPLVPMTDAIQEARASVERSLLPSRCPTRRRTLAVSARRRANPLSSSGSS
jgi:integrase